MSNFAETFGAIFRDVFGEWPPKPRIVKCFGSGWACRSLDGRCAFGETPAMAYHQWRSNPMVLKGNPGWLRSPQAAEWRSRR